MQPTRLIVLAVLAGPIFASLAACGKMGPPDTPPGSIWPRGYPAGAIARPIPGLINSGMDEQAPRVSTANAAKTQNADTTKNGFTQNGAWIDPDMRRPTINPTADEDKWHLDDPYGSGY